MPKTFMAAFNDSQALKEHQLKGLQQTVAHAYHGSPFYKAKLDAAGVNPQDIRNLQDIRQLPFICADDLRDGYPFPLPVTARFIKNLCFPLKLPFPKRKKYQWKPMRAFSQ